jgi:hypothetical protein
MFRTPKVGTRALAGIATIATLTGVTLPLMATAASAAVSSVTANPASYQHATGTPQTITADIVRTAGDTTLVKYAITAGADADAGGNGTLIADGNCTLTTVDATHAQASCIIPNTKGATTDTVKVFADTNANLVADAGEPNSDATIVFYGAPAAVDLQPNAGSAAAGVCKGYTVSVTDAGGRAVPSQAVKLEATLTGTATGRTLSYCDPVTTNPTSTNAGGGSVTGVTTPALGTVTTDPASSASAGKAAFGITSDQPGTASLRAYVDTNANSTFDAGEPADTSTQTFTAGGSTTGNAAQDAVATLAVAPTSQSVIAGDPVSYTITAKNSAGDVVKNAVINRTVTGANPSASAALAATGNNGQTTFGYTATNTGTDTITFWVNQTSGATAGADASEPKVTATTTVSAAPSGYTIDLSCKDASTFGSTSSCVQPLSSKSEVFTAFVSKGFDGSGNPLPSPGILVRFTASNTTAPGTPTPATASVTTDSKGLATYTLTDATAANNTQDSVTAVIAGQVGGTNTDTNTVTFQTPVATSVAVNPPLNTTQTGQSSTFVATVTDQFGNPVSGANVDFVLNAGSRNAALNGPALLNKTTNAAGQATLTYSDTGPVGTASNDSGFAYVDFNSNDAFDLGEPSGAFQNHFITEPATAGTVDLDVSGGLSCGVTNVDPANDSNSFAPSTTTHQVCALVKTAGGAPLAGKTVTFTASGVGGFAKADGTALTSPQTAVTDGNGVAVIRVKSTKSGAQGLTAAIDGKSDAASITYTAATPAQARNISLAPANGTIPAGPSKELTALVTDKFGNPVAGITVDFTETGAGSFGNGVSSASGVTGSTGTVSVTLTSPAGSTGTEAVTAAINNGAANTDCDLGANNPATGDPAGNCTDTRTYTFGSVAAPTITVSPTALNVGQYATVVVHGTAGDAVQLLAYSRPNTTYGVVRSGTIGSNGTVTFSVGPRTNTRLFAKTAGGSSTSAVISVRPAESLFGTATGKVGSFHGGIVPGHSGVTVRLFTVKNGVRSSSPVGTAVTDANGKWTFRRTFAATGPVTFISQTLSDLTSLAGQSNRITVTFK